MNPSLKEATYYIPKWVFPHPKALEQEYNVEYKHHVKYDIGDIFPTLQDFVRACKKGHPMKVSKQLDDKISNRSNTKNFDQLLNMIKQYRSYPEFRNETTLKNLYTRIESNLELDMPIILFHRGRARVMSGNTRMDVAFQLGVEPTCLIVEY